MSSAAPAKLYNLTNNKQVSVIDFDKISDSIWDALHWFSERDKKSKFKDLFKKWDDWKLDVSGKNAIESCTDNVSASAKTMVGSKKGSSGKGALYNLKLKVRKTEEDTAYLMQDDYDSWRNALVVVKDLQLDMFNTQKKGYGNRITELRRTDGLSDSKRGKIEEERKEYAKMKKQLEKHGGLERYVNDMWTLISELSAAGSIVTEKPIKKEPGVKTEPGIKTEPRDSPVASSSRSGGVKREKSSTGSPAASGRSAGRSSRRIKRESH